MATLAELTATAPRLALVGLAKNTGKTVTMNALLGELAATRETVGVTSVGRDGERHDVIDFRIDKPLVHLGAGDLVATTDSLLSASGVPYELLERTGMRTPLGEVLLARLKAPGAVEIAGPSAAADTRAVGEAMLAHGVGRVVIDGAIDRRAASAPDVSDGLVMSTGAILSEDIGEVVTRTAEAIALVRIAPVSDAAALAFMRALETDGVSALLDEHGEAHPLPERFVLTAEPPAIAELLSAAGDARWLFVAGALPQRFLDGLVPAVRRSRRELTVAVSDPTRLFLSDRSVAHYARAGIELRVLDPIDLRALSVNPVAPQSHSFDSGRLRGLLGETITDLAIFDVLHASYAADGAMRTRGGAGRTPRGVAPGSV